LSGLVFSLQRLCNALRVELRFAAKVAVGTLKVVSTGVDRDASILFTPSINSPISAAL
jgi:hypothetical protein